MIILLIIIIIVAGIIWLANFADDNDDFMVYQKGKETTMMKFTMNNPTPEPIR